MKIFVSGSFTQLLNLWLSRNNIQAPGLKQKLDRMALHEKVSVKDWREVLGEAEEIAADPHFGLEVGSLVTLSHVGVLGFLVSSSDTLGDGLQAYQLCEKRFYSVNFATLIHSDEGCTLTWEDALGDSNRLFVQVAISALVSFLRQRFPSTFKLEAVALTEQTPTDTRPYTDFFDCPVSFGSTQPGILVNSKRARQKETGRLPEAFRALQNQQNRAFSSAVGSETPFLHSLQPLLLRMLPCGEASLAAIATELGFSTRTFQRRLNAYNFSYQALLDAVREQLAFGYLQQESLTYVEIALLLGYSEQTAFNRAFKHWQGISPSAYRRQVSKVSKA